MQVKKSAKEEKKKKDDHKIKESSKDPQEKTPMTAEDGHESGPETLEKTEDPININVLKEQLDAEKDRVLRLSAEFENYKKRKQREMDEFKKFANETIFRQILPVVDNLERAMASAESNPDEKSLLEGVRMIHKEVLKIFDMFSVKVVNAEKQPFDPNFHQAVTRVETDEFPENTVTAVLQNGYVLHDRLIRPAMVVVSKKIENDKIKEN